MHRYRSHTCGALREADAGAQGAAVRAGATASATTAACCSSTCATITASRNAWSIRICPPSRRPRGCARRWVVRVDGAGAAPAGRHRNADMATGAIELYVTDIEVLGPAAELPMPVATDQEYPEETRLKLPLPRPAPRAAAREHHAARAGDRLAALAHEGAGVLRVPDADPHRLLAGGRARLHRAVARASGQVLRAAAGAAAVQAADHGGGLRPLFPDRALLPRRGRAGRPLARASSTSSTSR